MSAPKQRPILFSGPMVRAILDGRKSVTRRVVKPQPVDDHDAEPGSIVWHYGELRRCREPYGFQERLTGRLVAEARVPCPYGQPGDLLYVREKTQLQFIDEAYWTRYAADHEGDPIDDMDDVTLSWVENAKWTTAEPGVSVTPWRPSILVPKSLARIWLRVTDVSVERVQDITETDARAEGVEPVACEPASIVFGTWKARHRYRDAFADLWDSLNAKRGYPWESNPWVWRVAFERVEAP